MSDAPAERPGIWVLDDEGGYCEARLRSFEIKNIPARGFTSGEAFLAALDLKSRGVASIDIDLKNGGGSLTGIQVFERMLLLGCHFPVIFLTTPFGDHEGMAHDMRKRRSHVDYFSKLRFGKSPMLDQMLFDYLKDEPALYELACHERWQLQKIAIEMPHGEREALDGAIRGRSAKDWAGETGGWHRTLQQQLTAALRRYFGRDRLSGANHETVEFAGEIAPLMKKLRCESLQELAGTELARRLRLLDEPQQQALHVALKLKRDSESVDGVKDALQLMGLDDFAKFRELLKNGGQNLRRSMLPQLCGQEHRWARHWLVWAGAQQGPTPWGQLPDAPIA